MKQIVVGTAGHIDHGKTALIRALTGIDCDRLKEEKERGITTELGFAFYRFGEDLLVGIVDVPGHERFIRHMVAGAWGIDMVLFVIAADESVMPQTREHLDICDLLGIKRGIITITKKDLVDEEMLELVREEIGDLVKGRFLEKAPMVAVSSLTGENIDVLRDEIYRASSLIDERSREGIFRLPIDRVFTIRGFGTIVTGTCISGHIQVGEEVEVYPVEKRARIRNIQAYHQDVKEAGAGQRVALNLQGVEKQEIERGTIIALPGTLLPTSRIDASLRYLKLPFNAIKNNSTLRFHVATTQAEGKLILLGRNAIEPGDEAFVQISFAEPLAVLPGDRFIMRGSYAVQTLGGGVILDIQPKRHIRKPEPLRETYELLSKGTLQERLLYHVHKGGYEGMKKEKLAILLGLEGRSLEQVADTLSGRNAVKIVGRTVVNAPTFVEYKKTLHQLLTDFHKKNPFKIGISKEELRTKLPKVDPLVFQAALDDWVNEGQVEADKDKVRLLSAGSSGETALGKWETDILKRLFDYGLTPPSLPELAGTMNMKEANLKDMLERLVHQRKVTRVKSDMYFHADPIKDLRDKVVALLKSKGEMAPADFKAITNLSRKYMIPLLEYFDESRLTIRTGDKRVLRSS
ncbi:MAG TPA: selenocysteine-specific translation elongation factor [Deltaproteobacteria bacterium]|nr:selenocysteine-specific translation elongation factor [Deltaproteobacteria bacterium]